MTPHKLTLASSLIALLAPLTAHAASPIVVDIPSARFPDTAVSNSNVLTLTYSNGSNATHTVTNVALVGGAPGDFVVMPLGALPITIAPGGLFKAGVAFNPTKIGQRSATVTVTVAGQQSCDSTVSGQATVAAISANPAPLRFGGAAIGASVKQTVSFTNATMGQVNITGYSVSVNGAEFSASSQFNFPAVVPVGASLPIDVVFSPLDTGIRFGVVSITVQNMNNAIRVALIGSSGEPQVNLGNNAILFGNTHIGGASAPQMLSIGNIGYNNLKIIQVILAGTNPGDFGTTLPQLPASVAPGASLMYGMSFRPMAAGSRTATVTVVTDDPNNGTVSFLVGGTGVPFMQSISPANGMALDFGQVKTGDVSQPQSVLVMNTSMAPLNITNVFLTGAQAAAFVLSLPPMGPIEVKAGASVGFPMTFKPKAGGLAAARLNLQLDDPNTPVLTAELKGAGTAGAVTVSPLSVDFGSVPLTKSSAKKLVSVTNSGTAALNINTVTITGPDAVSFTSADLPSMPTLLDSGKSLTFYVTFSPAAHAVQNATIAIASDDPQSPTTNVILKGVGVQPRITVSPMSLDFGITIAGIPTDAQTVSITNTGDDNINIETVQVNGPASASFKVEGFGGSTRLGAGDQIVVGVRFAPAAAGTLTATLNVTPTVGVLAPVAIALKGSAAATAVSISPLANDFGIIDVGNSSDPVTFTVTNTSGGTLNLAPIVSSSASFVVETNDTVLMLPPGGKTTFNVSFAPTDDQMVMGQATLTLLAAPTRVIAKVTLTGQGILSRPGGNGGDGCAVARRGSGGTSGRGLLLLAALVGVVAGAAARRRRGARR